MAFDREAQPWKAAKVFLDEYGLNAVTELRIRYERLLEEGRSEEAAAVLFILRAVLALGPHHDPQATIH